MLAVHRQAMAANSPLKLGPLGIRLQGVEMSTHSLERMGDGATAAQRRRVWISVDAAPSSLTTIRLVDLDRSSSTAQSTLTRLASYPQAATHCMHILQGEALTSGGDPATRVPALSWPGVLRLGESAPQTAWA